MNNKNPFIAVGALALALGVAIPVLPATALPPLAPKQITSRVFPESVKADGGSATITVLVENDGLLVVPTPTPLPGEYISFFCSDSDVAADVDQLDPANIDNRSCANRGVQFASAGGLNSHSLGVSPGPFTSTGDGFTGPTGTYTTAIRTGTCADPSACGTLPRTVWITARSCDFPPALPDGPEDILSASTCEATEAPPTPPIDSRTTKNPVPLTITASGIL